MAYEQILPVQNRPAGSGVTPSRQFNVAAGVQTSVRFRFPMAEADILDPANTFIYEFQLSKDDANWQSWIGPNAFTGGPHNKNRQGAIVPEQCMGGISTPGTYWVRLTFTLNNNMRIGLEREVVEE